MPKLRRVDPIYPESRKWWLTRFSYRMFWIYKIFSKKTYVCTRFQSKMTCCITNPLSIDLFYLWSFYRTFWSGAVLNFIWPTRFLPDMSGGPTDLRKHCLTSMTLTSYGLKVNGKTKVYTFSTDIQRHVNKSQKKPKCLWIFSGGKYKLGNLSNLCWNLLNC